MDTMHTHIYIYTTSFVEPKKLAMLDNWRLKTNNKNSLDSILLL